MKSKTRITVIVILLFAVAYAGAMYLAVSKTNRTLEEYNQALNKIEEWVHDIDVSELSGRESINSYIVANEECRSLIASFKGREYEKLEEPAYPLVPITEMKEHLPMRHYRLRIKLIEDIAGMRSTFEIYEKHPTEYPLVPVSGVNWWSPERKAFVQKVEELRFLHK